VGPESLDLDAWLAALQLRHRSTFTSSEFLKALRALSVRYVERRSELKDRSPLDSAGKRAAFAAFYAPLHYLTTQHVVRALASGLTAGGSIGQIIDLGCGTGVASAAWAMEQPRSRTTSASAGRRTRASDDQRQRPDHERRRPGSPALLGIDSHPWALAEARWTWGQLGLTGETRRSDLVTEAERLIGRRPTALTNTGVVAGWSVNELDSGSRRRLLAALLALITAGAAVLVIEPIAQSAVPWWSEWAAAFGEGGGRADEWKFDTALPPVLSALDDAAGFRRRGLAARTLSAGL
jgi:hypothetical protein